MTKHNARVKVWNPVDPEIERRAAAVATVVLEVIPDELGAAQTWAIVEKAAERLREHFEKHGSRHVVFGGLPPVKYEDEPT